MKNWRHLRAGSLVAPLLLAGCGAAPELPERESNPYQLAQARYETPRPFHVVVLKPDFFKLEIPGLLVGIEEIERSRAGPLPALGDCDGPYCLRTGSPYLDDETRTRLREYLEDMLNGERYYAASTDHVNVVTHVARFERAGPVGRWRSCLLYNLYGLGGVDQASAARCEDEGALDTPGEADGAFERGWSAVKAMRAELRSLVDAVEPTHLLVLSSGWNTPQWESLANYMDWLRGIEQAAVASEADFRPVVVAITWPSYWDNYLGTRLQLDVLDKALDADEIGAVWANLLLHDVVLPVRARRERTGERLPVVLLGHSYGARILSRAAFSGYLVSEGAQEVDLLLGLQGAFRADRFLPPEEDANLLERWEGAPYRGFEERFVRTAVFTTSANDDAVWISAQSKDFYDSVDLTYVGAGAAYQYAGDPTSPYHGVFARLESVPPAGDGERWLDVLCDRTRVKLVDADDIVSSNVPGTGGHAHSDVYDEDMGALIWSLIAAIPACDERMR